MTHTIHIRKLYNNTGLEFALEARELKRRLENAGFTVQPLPVHQRGFTVSHSTAGAITVFLLHHGSRLTDWQIL